MDETSKSINAQYDLWAQENPEIRKLMHAWANQHDSHALEILRARFRHEFRDNARKIVASVRPALGLNANDYIAHAQDQFPDIAIKLKDKRNHYLSYLITSEINETMYALYLQRRKDLIIWAHSAFSHIKDISVPAFKAEQKTLLTAAKQAYAALSENERIVLVERIAKGKKLREIAVLVTNAKGDRPGNPKQVSELEQQADHNFFRSPAMIEASRALLDI